MENNTPTQKTPEQVSAAWAKMGLAMRESDMRLQAMAQAIIAKIKIPTTIAELPEAEKLLTELRSMYNNMVEERKKTTSILDGAIDHLMKSEKTVEISPRLIAPAIKPLTDAMVALKKQAEIEKNKVQWRNDELKQVKEQIATLISNHDAACKTKIIDIVDKAYSFALGNGDIKVEEVDNYISRCMKRDTCSEATFKIIAPSWQFKYVSHEEIHELWEHAVMSVRSPMDYRQDLFDAFKSKFEFYNIAVKNKEASLKQAAEEKEAAEAAIKKQASEAETANKLNAISNVHNPEIVNEHKALKKTYAIDMVGENWNDATIVMTAFVANLEKCKEEIRVKNIWNLSIAQMGVALSAIKNKDESFAFTGLKFKIMEKL